VSASTVILLEALTFTDTTNIDVPVMYSLTNSSILSLSVIR
jgi:hypothetical protein